MLVNAVTTWQAYNRWGGYSLYTRPDGTMGDRARAVSFDRPYQAKNMQGAGDFLFFELPLVQFAERSGLPLGYATDVDLSADPHLLDGARAMVTLGHDEYWSQQMRDRRHRRPRPRGQPGLPRRQRDLPAHPLRPQPARTRPGRGRLQGLRARTR